MIFLSQFPRDIVHLGEEGMAKRAKKKMTDYIVHISGSRVEYEQEVRYILKVPLLDIIPPDPLCPMKVP